VFLFAMKEYIGPYLIEWNDAFTAQDDWYDMLSIKKNKTPYLVRTVGWILKKETIPGYVTVFSSLSTEDVFFSVTYIPKKMIIRKIKLKK
jgi:hypothetical protein